MFLNDMVFLRVVSIELFGGHDYLYRLSGRGMRLGLGAKSSGATLFNFFIRRRTRSQRCMEEIIYFLLLLTPPVVPNCSFWLAATSWSHLDSRQLDAVARNFWSVKRHRCINSLASFDTLEKYSFGKLKSHPRILVLVSSSESSRKGDFPLCQETKK